jgi:hypothetical protein
MKWNSIVYWHFFSLLAIFSFTGKLYSQNHTLTNLDPYQLAFTSSDAVLSLTGNRIFSNGKPVVDENALLYPGWQKGVVNFNNGKQLRDVDLEFNLFTNELYFNNNNRPNLFKDSVKSFFIIDTLSGLSRIAAFGNGYPNLKLQTAKTYYLLLTTGIHAHLLKYVTKKMREYYDYGSAMKLVYEIDEELLIYDVKKNTLNPVKDNIASIRKALPGYETLIQQLPVDKKSKHLSDAEIMDVIKQVNNSQQ